MKRTLVALMITALCFCSLAIAADMAVVPFGDHWKKYTWTWTSNGSGVYSGDTVTGVFGEVVQLRLTPSGTSTPDDNYDVYLKDANGVDVLIGMGVDCPSSVTSPENYRSVYTQEGGVTRIDRPFLWNEQLHLEVSGAGDTKVGTVELIVR